MKKILWATDLPDEAQEVLLYADAFAKAFKASTAALHVIPDFSAAFPPETMSGLRSACFRHPAQIVFSDLPL